MIATALSAIVMAAVLSAFLLIGRTEANAYHYVTMEQQARRGLERFSQDVRMASAITWTDNTHVTLTLPQATGTGTDAIVYSYDSDPSSPTYRCFLRSGIDRISGVNTTQTLIREVETFEFDRWMLGSTGRATNDYGTKQLQIRLAVRRQSVTAAATTNVLVSARFILRNKS